MGRGDGVGLVKCRNIEEPRGGGEDETERQKYDVLSFCGVPLWEMENGRTRGEGVDVGMGVQMVSWGQWGFWEP